jgi:hypothetical protein
MSAAQRLSRARVEQLATEIRQAGKHARTIDAKTGGHISYAAMCGGLQAMLRHLVLDLAGDAAAAHIEKAFDDVFATDQGTGFLPKKLEQLGSKKK